MQLTDVAPTVLDRLGVAAPTSMEGRPFVVRPGHGNGAARRATLIDRASLAISVVLFFGGTILLVIFGR